MLTRRELWKFCGVLGGLALVSKKLKATAPRLNVDALIAASELALPSPVVRNYRVDAVVTLLGVAVFARKAVGSAFATIREAGEEEHRLIALRFAGGANPERTHGLLYDGSLEEVIVERGSTLERAAYFGFVTSSKDESFEQARKRILSSKTGVPGFYVAVNGLHVAGCARAERGMVSVDDPRQKDLVELSRNIRMGFGDANGVATEVATGGRSPAPTFLYTILTALRSAEVHSQSSYVHNAREYRLEWERTPDPHAAVPATSGAPTQAATVTRFTGRLVCLATRQVSTFRLWMNNQSVLPLRIEYQPRSYLRISLEYDPVGAQPNLSCTEET